jgi:hypothetical protein
VLSLSMRAAKSARRHPIADKDRRQEMSTQPPAAAQAIRSGHTPMMLQYIGATFQSCWDNDLSA